MSQPNDPAAPLDGATLTLSSLDVGKLVSPDEVTLHLSSGLEQITQILPLGEARVVGRSSEADLRIGSTGVSRRHARFEHTPDGVWLTDLASHNGTYIQGKRVDRARLKSGDVVTLGDVKVVAYLPAALATPAVRREALTLEDHLQNMGETAAFARRAPAGVLSGIKIFLIHHLTAEVLGTIAALRAIGCRDLEVLFVVYAGDTPEDYLTALRQVPADELHCLALTHEPSPHSVEGLYRLSSRYARLHGKEQIARALKAKPLKYVDAMRTVAALQFFHQLARARKAGQRVLVIEDGGYLSPLLNEAAILDQTVEQLLHPYDPQVEDVRPVREVLRDVFIGSVEHTRSGYERLADVERRHGTLAAPALSIAMSEYKVQTEAKDVVATVLNAVENILHAMGKTLGRRHCLVVGSRGVVGERLVGSLLPRLVHGSRQMCGVDPRINEGPGLYQITEAHSIAALPHRERAGFDLVLGVVGRSSFSGEDLERWLLESEPDELRLASGSSKTDEFSELSRWMNEITHSEDPRIGGHPVRISTAEIIDPKTDGVVAQRYTFRWQAGDGERARSVVFMANLMPVNFLFYGVPTETIDGVLCQLLRSTLHLVDVAATLRPHLYAVDVDITLPEGGAP